MAETISLLEFKVDEAILEGRPGAPLLLVAEAAGILDSLEVLRADIEELGRRVLTNCNFRLK